MVSGNPIDVPIAEYCNMVSVFKVKRSISRSSKQKYHFYKIELGTCLIPHFHVILTGKSISCTFFVIEGHYYYGFRRDSSNLLNSYLSNRKQYVQFGDTKSSLSNIMTGVPQDSILGPLLFIIYINDKASSIPRLLIYADDTTLYSTFLF